MQSKSTVNLAVNCSTEENICASGRWASYLYPSCSTGRINLYAKVGIYYTYNNRNKIFEWVKIPSNVANVQVYKYLTVSPSTNNNLRTLLRRNTPT